MALDDPLRALTEDLADRRATTLGERRAARWLVSAIRRQTHQVWQEPFRSFCSPRPAWALLMGLSMVGGVLIWAAPGVGLGISLLAALGFASQALGWLELGWLFKLGESQNVVGVVPSRGEIWARVVVVAHYDTGDRLWSGPAFMGLALAVMLLPLAAIGAAAISGAMAKGLVLLPLTGVAMGLVALTRPGQPYANDAGVAAALAVGRGEPLQHTEIWTLFTGSRAPGLVGMRAFLRRHGRLLAEAHFVVLEEQKDGDGATLWQRRGEAAVIAERGHRAVALLTVDPGDIRGTATRVRAIAEKIDRAASEEGIM